MLDAIPRKKGIVAPWTGSRGGQADQYRFSPTDADERRYMRVYQDHRFASTMKKGGWDCYRHVEIMANGAVRRVARWCEPHAPVLFPLRSLKPDTFYTFKFEVCAARRRSDLNHST